MSQGGPNNSAGSGAPPVETLTGNSGGAVGPDGAFNVDILGNNTSGIDVVGTPASNLITIVGLQASATQRGTTEYATAIETGTLTDTTRSITPAALAPILTTPYVVAPGGAYTTVQSALDAANAAGGGIVAVRPGSYTEDLTLYDACHITGLTFADAGGGVVINGTHTPPATGGFAFNNVELNDATAIFSSAAAGSAHLIIGNAEVNVTNGYTFDLANWTGKLEVYDVNGRGGTNDGWINNTGGSEVAIFSAAIGAGTVNTMQVSGVVSIFSCAVGCPINFATGSSSFLEYNVHTGTLTFSNNSTGEVIGCEVDADVVMSSSGNWTISLSTINSATNPVISGAGAGTLTLENVTYLSNASVAGTLTLSHPGTTEGGTYFAQTVNVGSRVPNNPYDISIDKSVDGLIGESIQNNSAGVSAGSNLQLIVEPLTADAFTFYGVNGGTNYSSGIDNSDSDSFKITTGNSPSAGTTAINITSAGVVTLPAAPLDVPSGGTGATSLTDNSVLVGSGASSITPISVGTNGQVLLGATAADPAFATLTSADSTITFTTGANSLDLSVTDPGVTNVVVQNFTADDTYTPTSGMAYCIIEAVGGGGGGGGAASDVSGGASVGGGGGSGEYGRVRLTAAQVGASQTVTMGTAGAAGANTGGNGGNGGNTSVGTLLVATGGSGGAGGGSSTTAQIYSSGGAGGIGGSSSAGVAFLINGNAGSFGTVSGTLFVGKGGNGGASYFGGGSLGANEGNGGVAGGANSGAGGSGGCQVSGGGGVSGGAGAAGRVTITEYVI